MPSNLTEEERAVHERWVAQLQAEDAAAEARRRAAAAGAAASVAPPAGGAGAAALRAAGSRLGSAITPYAATAVAGTRALRGLGSSATGVGLPRSTSTTVRAPRPGAASVVLPAGGAGVATPLARRGVGAASVAPPAGGAGAAASVSEIELKAGESILVRCAACGGGAVAEGTRYYDPSFENNRENLHGGKRKTRKASKKQEGGAKAKKGPNGFMRFSKEMRGKLAAEDAALKSDVVAMSRRIGEMWRGLSDSEKKRYSE